MSDWTEITNWQYETLKGKIVGCVRGKETAGRVAKYIRTAFRSARLPAGILDRMLAEVERESVRPFLGHPWNQADRLHRFGELLAALRNR